MNTEGDSIWGWGRGIIEKQFGVIYTMIEKIDHSVCSPSFVNRTFSEGV